MTLLTLAVNPMALVLIFVPIVIILLLVVANIKIVPQSKAYVIERLGAYSTTWDTGLHVKIPFIERVAKVVSLKEQVLDFPPQPVITKDNVTMQIDSVVFCSIFDARLYTYGVENPLSGLQNLAATTLRNIIGEMELDSTLTSRDDINTRMRAVLDEATDAWGMKVNRVEIKNIQPPHEIEDVMTKQMRAERERRQTVLEAQAHQEAVVARAEGDKKAKLLAAEAERDTQIALAEGRAKSIALVYEAEAKGIQKLNDAKISEGVLRLKGIEALKDISDGRATKIFLPSDISSSVSSLLATGEALGIGDATPVDKTPKPKKKAEVDPCIKETTSEEGKKAAKTSMDIKDEVAEQYMDPDYNSDKKKSGRHPFGDAWMDNM